MVVFLGLSKRSPLMTDSVSLTRDNSPEAFAKRMEKYETIPADKKEHPSQLPRWVKTALVYWALDGLTYKEAAERFNRKPKTLSMYAKSPAAKIWLSSLNEFLEDPVAMAKAVLSANAHSITLERFAFLEAAIDAGDYKEGDKIARDIQDRVGIVAKRQQTEAPLSIVIKLGGGDLSAAAVEAEYEIVDDE
jgi:hypothetical protein